MQVLTSESILFSESAYSKSYQLLEEGFNAYQLAIFSNIKIPGNEPFAYAILDDNEGITAFCNGACINEKKGVLGILTRRAILKGGLYFKSIENLELLLDALNKSLQTKALYTKINSYSPPYEIMSIMQKKGFIWEPHLNFVFDLTKGEALVWEGISSTRKKQIKRSYARGIEIRITRSINNIKPFYELLKITYSNAGLPMISEQYIERVTHAFQNAGKLLIIEVLFNGKLIAHRIILLHNRCMYDWYAGSDPKHYNLYPNDAAVWEALKWGCKNDFDRFDFGGAGHPDKPYGVRDFKQKFGGELTNYGIFTRINQPVKYKILLFSITIYKKLKKNLDL